MQSSFKLRQTVEPLPNLTHEAIIARLRAEVRLYRAALTLGIIYAGAITSVALVCLYRVWL